MNSNRFPYRLVILRHGQSEWNAAGVFTGWENAHLTTRGELEAVRAGALLAAHGVLPDFAHTSLQRRAIRTAAGVCITKSNPVRPANSQGKNGSGKMHRRLARERGGSTASFIFV